MKKLSIIVAALVLFFSAGASTPTPGEDEVFSSLFNSSRATSVTAEKLTNAVNKAFTQKFGKAQNVNWKKFESLYFAKFELNKKEFNAAYSEEGEMIAISRNVLIDQLPLAVTESLNEYYQEYKLPGNVTEIVMQGDTNYYLMVEGKTRYLQLKCSPDGNISIDKRIKKKVLVGSVS